MSEPTWVDGIGPPLEQIEEDYRDDGRGVSQECHDVLALIAAYRALLRRLSELEQENDGLRAEKETWLAQRWSFQTRAEVAERGHKAALARDFQQRDEIKQLRAALSREGNG
jgi:HPt (histidine-containing phosphotransfer) domain-containing protein